jgi:single-strand DNA-binding protein
MLNKIMLIGNLGRDPEVRSTPSGQAVTTFSVATSRKWKNRDGQQQDETEWYNVETWGRLAEICGQYLQKGSKVYIEGRGKTESWDDRDTGQKRYKFKVVAQEMKMLDSRGSSGSDFGGRPSGGGYSSGPPQDGEQGGGPVSGPDDDDIPF